MIKVFFSAFVLVAAIALTGCNKKEEEAEAPAPQQEETGDASTMSDSDSSTMDDSDASTMSDSDASTMDDSDTAATDDGDTSAASGTGEPKCPLCVIYEVATEGQPDDQTEFFSCADRPPEPPSLSWFEENCRVQQGDNQYFRSFAVEVMLPAN